MTEKGAATAAPFCMRPKTTSSKTIVGQKLGSILMAAALEMLPNFLLRASGADA